MEQLQSLFGRHLSISRNKRILVSLESNIDRCVFISIIMLYINVCSSSKALERSTHILVQLFLCTIVFVYNSFLPSQGIIVFKNAKEGSLALASATSSYLLL